MSETDGSPSADKDLTAELEKWKALARKHEERAKETFAELQKLKESQGSSKSDMDRLVQEVKALREENQKAKRDAMLASVAAKTGLSMAKVRRLQGENEAELLADAAEVFDWKPSDAKNGKTKDSQGDKDEPAKTDDAKADGKSNEGDGKSSSSRFGRPRENLSPYPGQVDKGGSDDEEEDPRKRAERLPLDIF